MRVTLIIIWCLVALDVLGQSAQIDSLRALIDNASDPKSKVDLLNQLSFALFDFDVEKAGATTAEALKLSQELRDKKGEGWALCYRGVYYLFSGELFEARKNFNSAHEIGVELRDLDLQIYAQLQLGNVYRDKGEFDSAFLYYRRAEKLNPSPYYRSIVNMNKCRSYLTLSKPDSALLEIKEAERLRAPLNNVRLMTDVWLLYGNCYKKLYDFDKAIEYYDKVAQTAPTLSTTYGLYLVNKGELSFTEGDFVKALDYWSKALSYHRKLNYRYELSFLLYRMAEAFEEQGYYDLAIEYALNSLKISEQAGYQFLNGEAYYELAWVYYRNSHLQQSIQNIKKAERVFSKMKQQLMLAGCLNVRGLILEKKNSFDSALWYHQQALAAREKLGDKVAISSSLYNLGQLYNSRREFDKALRHLWRGREIDESLNDKYGKSLYYYQIGRSYNMQNNDSALFYLNQSLDLAVPSTALDVLRNSYFELADYLQKTKKLEEAISYYRKYIQLNDSIFNRQTSQSLASFRTLYDVETKEKEIELLNKNSQLAKAEARQQMILLYSASAGLVVLIGLSVFYYRFAKRLKRMNIEIIEKSDEISMQSRELAETNETLHNLNRKISDQKEEIQSQAEELARSNQAILSANENLEERIEARTQELKQAYKELDTFFYRSSHDFRRPLTTFMGLAEVAKVTLKDPIALELFDRVNETARNLDKMLFKLQSISDVGSNELIYKEVSVKDLFELELNNFKDELSKHRIQTTVSVTCNQTFYSYPALVRIIVQNLIENAIRFSNVAAPVIQLSAFERNDEVVIQIKDNGQGIEPQYQDRVFDMYFRASEMSNGNGLGLYIVKKTVLKLNGRVELESEPGKGTTIRVFFPGRQA